MTDDESLTALQQRIKTADDARKNAGKKADNRAKLPAEAMALVGRIATEMVAGVAVGGFIGWLLDSWLGTSPLLMIVFFFLGAGAGMMNIWRMATGHGLKIGYFDHQKDTPADDDEQDRTRD
ncbi:MAG: AtpZ/AtpI family protein [Alphaproteobacteria bacterium]|nr:AtpZ/AtpI family protein [Alphaproteobacteria bacterium]